MPKENASNYKVIIINPPNKKHVIEKTKELSRFLSEVLSAKIKQNRN